MIKTKLYFMTLSVLTFLVASVPAAQCANEDKTTADNLNKLIQEAETMQETHQPLSQDYLNRALDTSLDLKSRADQKAYESQMVIEALERGEAPPMPETGLPSQILDEELDIADEYLRTGNTTAARELATQVLEQAPHSQRAQEIMNKTAPGTQ